MPEMSTDWQVNCSRCCWLRCERC